MTAQTASAQTASTVDTTLAAATAAAPVMAAAAVADRVRWLRAAADAVDAGVEDLVAAALEETHLPEGRLRGEVARTSGQLRMFADALGTGALLEAVIDTADPEASPVPRPDLRRTLRPVGPVLVFAASNFPFAFSVAGGDTASALAAGSPVVVKAHPGHPRTSVLTHRRVADALEGAGAPSGSLGLLVGTEAGVEALRDHRVKAAGFTGSVPGGLALHEVAASRPDPIPFYGELGSINPVFVTTSAVKQRGSEIAQGFVGSFTLGVGQFCTKPGLLFLPTGHGLEEALRRAGEVGSATMLHPGIREGYSAGLARLRQAEDVEVLVDGAETADGVSPSLLRTRLSTFLEQPDALLEECFGPASVIVEYDDEEELVAAAGRLEGSLTATLHAQPEDHARLGDLVAVLTDRAGRLVWNGWPTGVAVTWAMHHGGPFPSTVGSLHTSVGVTAVRRFQRPVCYQDTPEELLPEELRDRNTLGIERRVDGRVTGDDVRSSR
ncbi:MAG TPA: aldehyde dehydrogenase (NADP(+)) [Nocardioidaceae bacterium]|nr:aldehyde dehydrogenase (NADP(+)) [Nocardioidaceae bacterium]